MQGYSAGQLIRYYRWAKANPTGEVLPPGGRRDWDNIEVPRWLRWFWECLSAKMSRGMPAGGNGSRARKRLERIADAAAECKWCGQKTGKASVRFCCNDCARSYHG